MPVNPDVGAQYGYTAKQWAAMTPAERDYYKSGGSTGSFGAAAGISGGTSTAVPAAAPMSATYGMDTTAPDTGGYSLSAAPATRDLATAPEWLAYLSALGLEESQARADVDRMRGLYQSEAERLKQDLVPQYGQQRRGITGSLESRGMARSGELLRRLAENRAAEGRQRAGIESNLAGQVGTLESQLAQRLGSMASQRAQQEMALRAQGYV